MAGGIAPHPQAKRERLRPRLYGVAIYLVAGILLLQVFFCISVFVLRPYAKSKTPEAILGQERARATDSLLGGILRFGAPEKKTSLPATNSTNPAGQP